MHPDSRGARPDAPDNRAVVLGAGVSGLAAGMVSGAQVFEAESIPGGLCASYYMRPGSAERHFGGAPRAGDYYRFEPGGGHWIFGGEPSTLEMIQGYAHCRRISRRSSVFLHGSNRYIPYPIQENLRYLGAEQATRALAEIRVGNASGRTMQEWLAARFGSSLGDLFFAPFHEAYTAGLYRTIAPQDGFKSPIDLLKIEQGDLPRFFGPIVT